MDFADTFKIVSSLSLLFVFVFSLYGGTTTRAALFFTKAVMLMTIRKGIIKNWRDMGVYQEYGI